MTDGILCFGTHLGKGKPVCFEWGKDGVIPKAFFSDTLVKYLAFYNALKENFSVTLHEGDDGAEAGGACFCILQLVEEALDIGIRIMTLAVAVHGTETCRKNTWGTSEGIHLQTCIVSKAIYSVMLVDVTCLLQRIAFQCVGCFRDILRTTDIIQPFYHEGSAQNLADFLQLVGIVGGHYQFCFHFFIGSKPSPKTPSTLLMETNALGSMRLMS